MLDAFTRVLMEKNAAKQTADDLTEIMKQLPIEEAAKFAAGTAIKQAYVDCDSKDWLEKYEGTPLFEQAVALEEEGLQIESERIQRRAAADARRRNEQDDNLYTREDMVRLKKRLLDLDLQRSKLKTSVSAPVPIAPPSVDTMAEKGAAADAASPLPEEGTEQDKKKKPNRLQQAAVGALGAGIGAAGGGYKGSMLGGIGAGIYNKEKPHVAPIVLPPVGYLSGAMLADALLRDSGSLPLYRAGTALGSIGGAALGGAAGSAMGEPAEPLPTDTARQRAAAESNARKGGIARTALRGGALGAGIGTAAGAGLGLLGGYMHGRNAAGLAPLQAIQHAAVSPGLVDSIRSGAGIGAGAGLISGGIRGLIQGADPSKEAAVVEKDPYDMAGRGMAHATYKTAADASNEDDEFADEPIPPPTRVPTQFERVMGTRPELIGSVLGALGGGAISQAGPVKALGLQNNPWARAAVAVPSVIGGAYLGHHLGGILNPPELQLQLDQARAVGHTMAPNRGLAEDVAKAQAYQGALGREVVTRPEASELLAADLPIYKVQGDMRTGATIGGTLGSIAGLASGLLPAYSAAKARGVPGGGKAMLAALLSPSVIPPMVVGSGAGTIAGSALGGLLSNYPSGRSRAEVLKAHARGEPEYVRTPEKDDDTYLDYSVSKVGSTPIHAALGGAAGAYYAPQGRKLEGLRAGATGATLGAVRGSLLHGLTGAAGGAVAGSLVPGLGTAAGAAMGATTGGLEGNATGALSGWRNQMAPVLR